MQILFATWRKMASPWIACAILLLTSVAAPATTLHLKNGVGNEPVSFYLGKGDSGHHCFRGETGHGTLTGGSGQEIGGREVAAGDQVTVQLTKPVTDGCDKVQSYFVIRLSSHPNVGIGINYNQNGVWMNDPMASNPLGRLTENADRSWTWETIPKHVITAGKPVGDWKFLCSGICNKEITSEIQKSNSSVRETSSEIRNAVSVSLSAGVELGAFSAGAETTASRELTTGQRMSQELGSAESRGEKTTVAFTPEQMTDLDIYSVWQWIATSALSNGTSVTITTQQFTCRPDGNKPTYPPGSPEDIASCRPKKKDAAPMARPVPPTPNDSPPGPKNDPPAPPKATPPDAPTGFDSVSTALKKILDTAVARGLVHVADVRGQLNGGTSSPLRPIGRLQAGRSHWIVVTGDNNTTQLDLTVIDQSSRRLASDPVPNYTLARQLKVNPSEDQDFNAIVNMTSCSVGLCYWGLSVFQERSVTPPVSQSDSSTPPKAPPPGAPSGYDTVSVALKKLVDGGGARGLVHVGDVRGQLNGGTSSPLRPIGRLQADHSYWILVTGDSNTTQLDLTLIDQSGGRIASDPVPDYAFARQIELSPSEDQDFSAVVNMTICRVQLCYWGLTILRQ